MVGGKGRKWGELEKEREGGFGLVCKMKNIFLNKKYEERRKKILKNISYQVKKKNLCRPKAAQLLTWRRELGVFYLSTSQRVNVNY